jgi:aspartokinase/homoserine dehydrogenase 1
MKVLKFGGSSVANAKNIRQAGKIITGNDPAQKQLVVVSALGGITDQLISIGVLASGGDESYKQVLETIENRHLDTARELLPVTSQSSCLSMIKQYCNELEDLCEGVFRLQELSLRTRDRIISFGELLSSKIIAAFFNLQIQTFNG